MKRDFRDFNAPPPNALQDLRRKVQTGSGRGHGASLLRVDGLVAFPVSRDIVPADIGWKWDVSQPFNDRKKLHDWIKAQAALAEGSAVDDLRPQFIVFAEEKPFAYADFAPWPNKTFPFIRFG